MRTIWYWHKNSHIDQWNRIENPEINPCLYGQLIPKKGDRSIKWSKNSSFNKWCWEIWTGTWKKKKTLDHQLTPYTRINPQWIKDLNISCDTIKTMEENKGSKISDSSCSNIFANICPRARAIKEKNKQVGLHQIKKLLQGLRKQY